MLGVVVLVAAGAALVALGNVGPQDPAPLAQRVDPRLPDLSIAPLSELTPALRDDGRRFLRFGVTIVNVGEGDFRLRAGRSHVLADDWRVVQLVPEAGGGYTEHPTPATLVYGGDGHGHWHVREVEAHRVETPDGTVVGEVVKGGFCFFDTTSFAPSLPGAAPAKVYRSEGCGGQLDTRSTMGLSIGWGDEYPWHLLDQQIDVTDLPDGRYRVRAIADPFGWFDELDETNNEAWTDIELYESDGLPAIRILGSSDGSSPGPTP